MRQISANHIFCSGWNEGKNIFSQTAYENVTHVQDQNTSLQELETNMTLHSIPNQVHTTKWRIRLEY